MDKKKEKEFEEALMFIADYALQRDFNVYCDHIGQFAKKVLDKWDKEKK